jgi:hypothetical protein
MITLTTHFFNFHKKARYDPDLAGSVINWPRSPDPYLTNTDPRIRTGRNIYVSITLLSFLHSPSNYTFPDKDICFCILRLNLFYKSFFISLNLLYAVLLSILFCSLFFSVLYPSLYLLMRFLVLFICSIPL